MSSWMGSESEVKPLASFEGAGDEPTESDCPIPAQPGSDRVRIEIVTGPGGSFVGSKILVNGKEPQFLTFFELSGEIGEAWRLTSTQWVKPEVHDV